MSLGNIQESGAGLDWGRCACLLVCGAIFFLALAGCSSEAVETERYFDIPEGDATSTLKEAAKQADVEILFSSQMVRDRTTTPIRGKYMPSVAFTRMLSDPSLVVMQHESSGVYTIKAALQD